MLSHAKITFLEGIKAFNEKWIKELSTRFKSDSKGSKSSADALLEHHTRAFILDKLIAALGWRSEADAGGPSNIFSEAFIQSATPKATTLFLDYLGFNAKKDLPLLVFEAKRFIALPPKYLIMLGGAKKPAASFASSKEALSVAFKDPSWVKGEWKEHIEQLTKYYNAIVKEFKHPPSVMAIGNGEWLVILREPSIIFNGNGTSDCFDVYEPEDSDMQIGDAYVRNFNAIFNSLAFERLSKEASGVPPELIPSAIRTATHVEIMRGVRVGYSSVPRLKVAIRPQIEIEPIVFVRSPPDSWILVELTLEGIDMPHNNKFLADHLTEVEKHSNQLVERIKANLLSVPTEISIQKHYGDPHSFAARPGVVVEGTVKAGIDGYVLVTGTATHFILRLPRVLNCPKHVWGNCDPVKDGRHPPIGGLSSPSYVGTKAFFVEGRDHHCAASTTYGMKSMKYDKLRITDFGRRSSEDGEPFCEIFNFEEMLCCQTCVFLDVCAQSRLFKLPCM